jgi:hypothetical protein
MVRKWHEHQGCVDLDKILAYVQAYQAYKGELEKCETRTDFQPGIPPTLGDYILDAVSQNLGHLLKYENCMKIKRLVENN